MERIVGTNNSFLKRYIDYIYHFVSSDAEFERQLVVFPNIGSAISFYFNTIFIESAPQEFISFVDDGNMGAVLHNNRNVPVQIVEYGRQERIVVVFKPLGINNFIATTLENLSKGSNPTNIDMAIKEPAYCELLLKLKDIVSVSRRTETIEDFLVSVFRPFQELRFQSLVENFNPDEKLETIAAKSFITTKTMDRLFKKHIGLTPVEFRTILKFRRSVLCKLSNGSKSLRELAFEGNYNDLPYMTKMYRKFTRQTSKMFFDHLSVSAGGYYLYRKIL